MPAASEVSPTKYDSALALVDGRGLERIWTPRTARALVAVATARAKAQVLGDGPRWLGAISALEGFGPVAWSSDGSAPEFISGPSRGAPPDGLSLDEPLSSPPVQVSGEGCVEESRRIEGWLQQLSPWRKGPFRVLGVDLDAEWRCDLKWERLRRALQLNGKTVLDVGCGNGYYLLRALGDGAAGALGIDPTWLYVAQFSALRRLVCPMGSGAANRTPLEHLSAWVLPLALEDVPPDAGLTADVVLSMGVLYHRKSPIEHLEALRSRITPGGQLVLETLVVAGGASTVFLPPGRYAAMRNVWMIPSVEAARTWLTRCGYRDVRLVDVTWTTPEEQRRTRFMASASLADFLDAGDPRLTIEGHPAPQRALFVARRAE